MKTEPNEREAILEPDLPIVDPHHHLWGRTFVEVIIALTGRPRYVLEDLLADAEGHNLVASVVIESHTTYRADGPEDFKVVGETEFFNGQAALSASGAYGESRIAAGIVGAANLLLGDQARPVLEAHIAAGNGRFRGVRQSGAWDRDEAIRKIDILNAPEGLYRSDTFRKGFAHLEAVCRQAQVDKFFKS
jgi:predicted TIM-barrel fold metal-dependent hydrolase